MGHELGFLKTSCLTYFVGVTSSNQNYEIFIVKTKSFYRLKFSKFRYSHGQFIEKEFIYKSQQTTYCACDERPLLEIRKLVLPSHSCAASPVSGRLFLRSLGTIGFRDATETNDKEKLNAVFSSF